MRRTYFPIALLVLAALGWPCDLYLSHACTLWGATGQPVEGGGTLIAKNRDWAPDQHHELQIVKPDNSIWRTGSNPAKTRTLATWLVAMPPSGNPQLYLKTADPGQPERNCRLAVKDALQMESSDTIALEGDLCRPDKTK